MEEGKKRDHRKLGKELEIFTFDDEIDTYKIRKSTKDIYPMKLWIFKYHNWILINFYWFKPIKKPEDSLGNILKDNPDIFVSVFRVLVL